MSDQKQIMQQMLQDVVDTFSPDPSNIRSVSDTNCIYFPDKDQQGTSPGCAIGMYIPWSKEKYFKGFLNDETVDTLLEDFPELLPKWMRSLPAEFLSDLQFLHDNHIFWADKGLSEKGIEHVIYVEKVWKLNSIKIKKYK
jgi:hypothetical protein